MKLLFLVFALALCGCMSDQQVSPLTSSKTEQPRLYGVEVRFKISRVSALSNSAGDRRTYEDAMLMAFDEPVEANFDQLFRIKLIAKDQGLTAKVNVTLYDNILDGILVGNVSAEVPIGGESLLNLPPSNGNEYAILLKAEKRALPPATKR